MSSFLGTIKQKLKICEDERWAHPMREMREWSIIEINATNYPVFKDSGASNLKKENLLRMKSLFIEHPMLDSSIICVAYTRAYGRRNHAKAAWKPIACQYNIIISIWIFSQKIQIKKHDYPMLFKISSSKPKRWALNEFEKWESNYCEWIIDLLKLNQREREHNKSILTPS